MQVWTLLAREIIGLPLLVRWCKTLVGYGMRCLVSNLSALCFGFGLSLI